MDEKDIDKLGRFDPNPEQLPDAPDAPEQPTYLDQATLNENIESYLYSPQYIQHHTAVLRPIRQVLYDRVKLRPGVVRSTTFKSHAWADNEGYARTNMTLSGMLGTPLIYDLNALSIHPAGESPDYKREWDRFLESNAIMSWYFGQNTRWLSTPVILMEPRFIKVAENDHRSQGQIPEIIRSLSQDRPLPRYVDFTTPQRMARRIDSTESFRGEIDMSPWSGQDGFMFYMVMHGILYTTM